MITLGIDIGGSGIKGALVDTVSGEMISQRIRIPTPEKGKPEDVGNVVKEICKQLEWKGLTGCGFPVQLHQGVALTAANIHKSWIGKNAGQVIQDATGLQTFAVNDADAAGIAEMRFGAGKELNRGVVMLLTIGTGVGSAIFVNGQLLPNTEFGHVPIRGKDAELRSADVVRQDKNLSWKKWSKRLQEHLDMLELLISPDVFIIGGGVSKQSDQFFPFLKTRAVILPATLQNQAGLIGAAVYAAEKASESEKKK